MGSKIIDSDSRTEAQPKHRDQTALDSVTLRGPSPSGVSSETERLHISATLIVTVDFSEYFFEMLQTIRYVGGLHNIMARVVL